MPSKGGIQMGRSGSSGGRVNSADRNRVVETGNGTFRLTGRRRDTFATRRDAELAARNQRISSGATGRRIRTQTQNEEIRQRLRQRQQRAGD